MKRLARAALVIVAIATIAATLGSAERMPATMPALLIASAIALITLGRFVAVKERARDPRN